MNRQTVKTVLKDIWSPLKVMVPITGIFFLVLWGLSKTLPVPPTREVTTQELTELQREAYESGANEAIAMLAFVLLQDEMQGTNRAYSVVFEEVRTKLDL